MIRMLYFHTSKLVRGVLYKNLAINSEGLALLGFRAGVDCDPYGTFSNGNSSDSDACMWLGVHCVDSKVQTPH